MSPVPDVLDALRTAFATVLPDLQILDGPPVVEVEADFVTVGYGGDDAPGVETTVASADLVGDRVNFDVLCMASSLTGDSVMKPRRDRVYELLDTIKAELRRDPSVGGVCAEARFGSHEYIPEQTSKGAMATVIFRVAVVAFT